MQDLFTRCKELYSDAQDAWRDNHERMRVDMRFSNPVDPQQWDARTRKQRDGRVTLTLDHTNQFIQQVSNDARQNTPSIRVTPSDELANTDVAAEYTKRLRAIEYRSRAGTAYDTGVEHAARVGLGWLRFAPVMVDEKLNYQEPRITTVMDPLAALIDGNSVEYDGSDAKFGSIETAMSLAAFRKRWPKASEVSAAMCGAQWWLNANTIRVAEQWVVLEDYGTLATVADAEGKQVAEVPDTELKGGERVTETRKGIVGGAVKWLHLNGVEVLDETDFPCKWIGLIPIYGHLLFVDGKRYVGGLTRRLADGQRFHNYQMSALGESLVDQPKAPFMAAARAIEGLEKHWQELDKGNPSYLPFNDLDLEANVPDALRNIPAPQRISPPQFPAAFAQAAQLGINEMMAAVGMNRSVLGQQSNAVSGRAKIADKVEGDTATFHYIDNQRRSIEHLGRCLLDMHDRLVDKPRSLPTMGLDDKAGVMRFDPTLAEPVQRDGNGKLEAINPSIGKYDVRVKVGPGYTTLREELKDRLKELGQSNPQLAAALAPLLIKLEDLPEAEKIVRVCLALLPPNVQAAYNEDDEQAAVPPAVKAQMQGMQQQLEQAGQMVQQLQQALQEAQGQQAEVAIKAKEAETKQFEAESARITAEADMLRAETEALGASQDMQQLHHLVQKTRDDVAALLGGGGAA